MESKVILGKDGFRFLGGSDSNEFMAHLTGRKEIQGSAIRIHESNIRNLEKWNIPSAIIIIPEAHVLYSEMLPDEYLVEVERPIQKILALNSSIIIYGYKVLRNLKNAGTVVYTGRDSHWTEPAAYEFYLQIRGVLGKRGPLRSPYTPSYDNQSDDLLTEEIEIVKSKEATNVTPTDSKHKIIFSNGVLNHGAIAVIKNVHGSGRLLAFGTSFSRNLIPAYATDFEEVIFCYGTAVDENIVEFVQPDCIIVEMPERFVHFPSIAVKGSTLAAAYMAIREGKKYGQGADHGDAVSGITRRFIDRIRVLCDPDADAHSISQEIMAIDKLDSSTASRVAQLIQLTPRIEKADLRYLRALIGGVYLRPLLISKIYAIVDSGRIALGDREIFPPSEMGEICAIRLLIKAGLMKEAEERFKRLEMMGTSDESEYYKKYYFKGTE